ncbi:hypothetical protein EFB14_21135 [Rhizobium fabae]|uniref:Uncharacterized protein n=1 Tax=Rhizobium fabae TaxID=573179 RepID=A0ABY0B5J3_9HYPH|nr:hypothetical protein EFB14_21135 [Rhizobium fabae]
MRAGDMPAFRRSAIGVLNAGKARPRPKIGEEKLNALLQEGVDLLFAHGAAASVDFTGTIVVRQSSRG